MVRLNKQEKSLRLSYEETRCIDIKATHKKTDCTETCGMESLIQTCGKVNPRRVEADGGAISEQQIVGWWVFVSSVNVLRCE